MPTITKGSLDSHFVIGLLERNKTIYSPGRVGRLDGALGVLHMDTSTDSSKPRLDLLLEVANLKDAYFEFTQMPTCEILTPGIRDMQLSALRPRCVYHTWV